MIELASIVGILVVQLFVPGDLFAEIGLWMVKSRRAVVIHIQGYKSRVYEHSEEASVVFKRLAVYVYHGAKAEVKVPEAITEFASASFGWKKPNKELSDKDKASIDLLMEAN